MYVEYSGWTEKDGFFRYDIFVNEKKMDYELHYASGKVAKQNSPFTEETGDWNHDGDYYTLFGAWFRHEDEHGNFLGGEFWSVEQMVRAVIDAKDPDNRFYGDHIVDIPGIEIPSSKNTQTLDDHLRHTEQRAAAQEAERNRKMDMLGIRPPNESWPR